MTTAPTPAARLGQVEFIALMAMLSATVAFSIDSMLPALPDIGAELSPADVNRAQLILTSFVLGLGLGTFVTGPMSDAWGRRPVILGGAALYALGALLAWAAPSLEWMLAARVLQGLGAAAPRVVAIAMVRDLHAGRDMARITSFIMIVFMIVPAIAPSLGALIINAFGWRSIFLSFLFFSLFTMLWLGLRQPETLPPDLRRPLRPALLWQAMVEVLSNPITRLATLVQTLAFGMLFGLLSAIQPVFDLAYGEGDRFPLWFALIAVFSAAGSALNARLIRRLGIRSMVTTVFAAQVVVSAAMLGALFLGLPRNVEFALFLAWAIGIFMQGGLTIGNLNALALEPMGHIAGMAASVTAALATVGSVILAAPIGLAFDGTPVPVVTGLLVLAVIAAILARTIPRTA
jgi:DHA1 family bicyclomycin/chloramphenicol resistance-like MFS transporter